MDRRRFLAGSGVALAGSFTGCLSALDSDGSPPGTEDLATRFWLEEVSLSTAERDAVTPIVFGELSAGEQEIVQTAIEDGAFTVEQGSESPSAETLRDRIERRTGNGETLEAYLRRRDTYFRIGFADGDHIIAHPDH